MIARLTSVLKRLGRIASRAWLGFIVLAALLWFGGLAGLTVVHKFWPPVVEEPPPLGGDPIRVVLGELELDIPRIRIVRITPADGDTLWLNNPNDRVVLAGLEEAARGARLPIQGASFTFYSAFGPRSCELPQNLQFLCEYGRPGERPRLIVFGFRHPTGEGSDRVTPRHSEFDRAALNGVQIYSENFLVATRHDGGRVFRGTNDPHTDISCPDNLCFQHGLFQNKYLYNTMFSYDINDASQLERMSSLYKYIVIALSYHADKPE